MGELAGPQAQLTHLSLAWHNLCVSHIVWGWSGSEGMNGRVFMLTEIQEDATWGSSGTEWCHPLHGLKGKHAAEIVSPVFDPNIGDFKKIPLCRGGKASVIVCFLKSFVRTGSRFIGEDAAGVRKENILFRKFIYFLVTVQRCFWWNALNMPLSIALEWMNSPSKRPQCKTRAPGRQLGSEESVGQNEKTEMPAWQHAQLQGQFFPPETEINIKLNLCVSSPQVTSQPSFVANHHPSSIHLHGFFFSLCLSASRVHVPTGEKQYNHQLLPVTKELARKSSLKTKICREEE